MIPSRGARSPGLTPEPRQRVRLRAPGALSPVPGAGSSPAVRARGQEGERARSEPSPRGAVAGPRMRGRGLKTCRSRSPGASLGPRRGDSRSHPDHEAGYAPPWPDFPKLFSPLAAAAQGALDRTRLARRPRKLWERKYPARSSNKPLSPQPGNRLVSSTRSERRGGEPRTGARARCRVRRRASHGRTAGVSMAIPSARDIRKSSSST